MTRALAARPSGARKARALLLAAATVLVAASCGASSTSAPISAGAVGQQSAQVVTPRVVAQFPHDRAAFTQGLIVDGDVVHESTGLLGRSEVRRVRLSDGSVLARSAIPPRQFGEGMARHGNELVSLTWQDHVAYRWDAATLAQRGTFSYPWDGWGLTADGQNYILSDGSSSLRFLDPASFALRRQIIVTRDGTPVDRLNELEWVDGRILANVWMSPEILVIDPASGHVTHVIDCRAIVAGSGHPYSQDAVLNGIAWDASARRLFVTGKLWPTLYEIIVPGLTD